MTEADQFVVITTIRGQFRGDDLDCAIEELADIAGEDVSIGRKEASADLGSLIPEVIHVATNGAVAYVGAQLVAAASKLAKRLWERRRERGEDPGEIGVIIYGPKGEELTRVVAKPPDGDPESYDGRMSPLGYRVGDVEWTRGPKSPESNS